MNDATLTLDEITNWYLDSHQLPQSQFDRISRLAIRGYRLFYRDSTGFPMTVTLTVQANGTAVLPVNALNKISVGVLNNRGEIASLTYDPLLSSFDAEASTRESQTTIETLITNEEYLIAAQELQGGLVPLYGYGQYGVGGTGTIGFYNIDWQQRVMIFNFGFCPSTVEFVYLGLPCEDGCYLIHPFFQEALLAWMNWQDILPKRNVGVSEKQLAERNFNVQYDNARKSMAPFDPSDVYNLYRRNMRLSVKT